MAHEKPDPVSQAAFELADLASAIGVLVLGLAAGALAGRGLSDVAGYFIAAGVLMHAIGMFWKHQLQNALLGRPLWWVQALYLTCWVVLTLTLVYLAG